MGRNPLTRRVGALAVASLLALVGMAAAAIGSTTGSVTDSAAGSATGSDTAAAASYPVQYCAQIPIVGTTPPWGFHAGAPITGATGSYARGHGNINLVSDTVSGILCQVDRVRNQPDRLVIMTVQHHLIFHSHYAVCGVSRGTS
jgi:hypothetical protein